MSYLLRAIENGQTIRSNNSPIRLAGVKLVAALLAIGTLWVAGCERAEPQRWSPPPPINFSIDPTGAVSFDKNHATFLASIGQFAVDLDIYYNPVAAEQTGRTPGQFVTLIIRHGREVRIDEVFQVAAGEHVIIDIDRRVRFPVTNRRLLVDATAGKIESIQVDSTGHGPGPSVRGGRMLPGHELVGTLSIAADSTMGIRFVAPRSGVYQFTYQSGSYSTYPTVETQLGRPSWLTTVLIFRGEPGFTGDRIRKEDALASVADTRYWATAAEAESSAQGQYTQVDLQQGDVLTLVGVDKYRNYAGNPGVVLINCEHVHT